MHGLIAWWKDEISERPVMAAVLAVWCITALWNFSMGAAIGGGGVAGWSLGAVFVLIAALGAYAAHEIRHETGLMRLGCAAMIAIQICLGQVAGWQSLGLSLDAGASKLDANAKTRANAKAALDRAEAERTALGTPRPVGSIMADEKLECARTSTAYKDGVGPKCTAYRGELAAAKRAGELDKLIPELTAALREAPAMTDANAATAVPQAFAANVASWVTGKPVKVGPDDVRFALEVFVVAVLEFVGTLGPWLWGRRHVPVSPAFGPGGGRRGSHRDDAPGLAPGPDGRSETGTDWTSLRAAVEAVMGGVPARGLAAPEHVMALPAPGGASNAYGAPINIHFTAPGLPPTGVSGAVTPGAGFAIAPTPAPFLPPVGHDQQPLRPERHDLPALPADAPPVDRSRVGRALAPEEREAADVILAFRAACVVDAPGGIVSGEHLYKRYVYWAGPRALDEVAFVRLFGDLTGHAADDLGGLSHWRGIALRAAPALQAVA